MLGGRSLEKFGRWVRPIQERLHGGLQPRVIGTLRGQGGRALGRWTREHLVKQRLGPSPTVGRHSMTILSLRPPYFFAEPRRRRLSRSVVDTVDVQSKAVCRSHIVMLARNQSRYIVAVSIVAFSTLPRTRRAAVPASILERALAPAIA